MPTIPPPSNPKYSRPEIVAGQGQIGWTDNEGNTEYFIMPKSGKLAAWETMNPNITPTQGGGQTQPPPSGSTTTPPSTPPYTSPGGVDVQPGLDWLATQQGFALEKYIADLTARSNTEQIQAQRDIAAINRQAQAESDRVNADLQRELQAGRIDADKYLQQKELAQRENEFTRTIALQTRQQAHAEAMDKINAELATAEEIRKERTLQAELASNPANTVMYEFYKRGMGTPTVRNTQTTAGIANPPGQPGQTPGGPNAAATAQAFMQGQGVQGNGGQGPVDTTGASYGAAQDAYSDQSLQQLAASIMGGGGAPGAYNPALSGTGAFGANIVAPNDISRSQFLGMDPTSLAVLGSFLRGGIQMDPNDPNSRVAINPDDYFQQMQNSFIPTLPGANQGVRYH